MREEIRDVTPPAFPTGRGKGVTKEENYVSDNAAAEDERNVFNRRIE
jgi:hypothetical protein